jgi:hypothetical protein
VVRCSLGIFTTETLRMHRDTEKNFNLGHYQVSEPGAAATGSGKAIALRPIKNEAAASGSYDQRVT